VPSRADEGPSSQTGPQLEYPSRLLKEPWNGDSVFSVCFVICFTFTIILAKKKSTGYVVTRLMGRQTAGMSDR
jgi:hypothetical protein